MNAPASCILGIDLGSRRIGLSVSDPEARIAFPAGVLERRGPVKDMARLRALVAERGVCEIVVGLPIHMSGRKGPEAAAASEFARQLKEATGLPVALQDERWTSREAERALREMGHRKKERPGRVDEMAATLILSTYLERRRRGAAAHEPSDGVPKK
ncbi:MAG TPA: Holliday junction resolvase RuvX [Deltaproteobacteria bacterium]|jgi:putative Holliday junction resolvase|nr:Holliday junction resolvase RuvX [Deltaproteobacteria bacterium]